MPPPSGLPRRASRGSRAFAGIIFLDEGLFHEQLVRRETFCQRLPAQVEGVLKNGSVRLIIMMVLRKNCVDFDAMSVKENEDKTVAKPPAQIPRLADAQRSMMRLPAVPRGGFQFPESGGFQKSQAEKLLMIRAWGWHY